jgi:hypothetical protein
MRQRVCIKFCANLGKRATESLKMIRQAFGKENMTVHGCLNGTLGSWHTEIGETGKEQSQEPAHHFL